MKERVTIVKGPIPPLPESFLGWQSLFRIIYSVSLDNGLIVTNPDQFPEETPRTGETAPFIEKQTPLSNIQND